MGKKTYVMRGKCNNCGYTFDAYFKCGERLPNIHECPYCECFAHDLHWVLPPATDRVDDSWIPTAKLKDMLDKVIKEEK